MPLVESSASPALIRCEPCCYLFVAVFRRASLFDFARQTAWKLAGRCTTHGSCGVLLALDAVRPGALLEAVADQLAIERRGIDPEDFASALLLPASVMEHL